MSRVKNFQVVDNAPTKDSLLPALNREENLAVYEKTMSVVKGSIFITPNGVREKLNAHAVGHMMKRTRVVYPFNMVLQKGPHCTQIQIVNQTTFCVAQELVREGFKPLVLDMANRRHPGGGVRQGSNAQEEILCRQSNLMQALEMIEKKGGYPFPVTGGILIPGVQFFRNDPQKRYEFLEKPFSVDVFASAAFHQNDRPKEEKRYIEDTKEKIRTMFRTAISNGNDALVLGAFGCGAFGNDPKLIARLYKEILETEFQNQFKKVVFAIVNDRNGTTNYQIFENIFSKKTNLFDFWPFSILKKGC